MKNILFTEAKDKLVRALEAEGFGELTEIDARATFKNKLGGELPLRKDIRMEDVEPHQRKQQPSQGRQK